MNTIISISSATKKLIMWYEITHLKSEKLTNPQIAAQLGIHRTTVSKYLSMTEEEFKSSQTYKRSYSSVLDQYESNIHSQLELCNDLSASQIHDRLKERYQDFPNVNEKTVYNFVQRIRKKYNIEKSSVSRIYQKCEETAYGQYAQVDFGERYIQDKFGVYKKVYFFAMVLSRSRAKYIFFSNSPFNAELAVYAHELAFQYFGGVPKTIIYDQDKVFLVRENFGNYQLTETFSSYVSHSSFTPLFCRKEDPESKGKCENVVKYVKSNFLKGRVYTDTDTLNQEAIAWLARTGNGKKHAGTRKIPTEVLMVEKGYLQPYSSIPQRPTIHMREYAVRKDNTIHYKGCFYSVPAKTYENSKSICYVEEKDGVLYIFSQLTGKQIGIHKIPTSKGEFILQPGHHVAKQYKYPELEERIYKYLGKDDFIKNYLHLVRIDKPRYYCDALRHILANMEFIDIHVMRESIIEMTKEQIYNPQVLVDFAQMQHLRENMRNECIKVEIKHQEKSSQYEIDIEKSDINFYTQIMG